MVDLILRNVPAISAIDPATWDSLANPGWRVDDRGTARPIIDHSSDPGLDISFNPFTTHAFLSSCEESGCASADTGWHPCHLLLGPVDGPPVGAVPLYIKAHSLGEYVFDHGWAEAYARAGGTYYPKAQSAIPFTPVNGPRLLASGPDAAATKARLAAGLATFSDRAGLSSAHATFVTGPDADALAGAGFLARLDIQYHFSNPGYRDYADFLDELSSRKRKALRRERRDALASGLDIRRLTGSDITEAHWDAFHDFYLDTGSRKWGRPYLNRRFFSLIGERLSGQILLVMAFRNGRPIAGALNLIGSDALYGRNWGTLEDHPFLHFEACYHQAIEFAIERGLSRVEAGAQGEHKIARGYRPVLTRSFHHIASRGLRKAVADFLSRERAAVEGAVGELAGQLPFRCGGED